MSYNMLHISSASDSADRELSKCMWQVTSERTKVSASNAIQPPFFKSYHYFSFTIVFLIFNSSICCSFEIVERAALLWAISPYQPHSGKVHLRFRMTLLGSTIPPDKYTPREFNLCGT